MGERAGIRPHDKIFAQHLRVALRLQRRGAGGEGNGYYVAADWLDRAGDGRGAQRGDHGAHGVVELRDVTEHRHLGLREARRLLLVWIAGWLVTSRAS